VFEPPPVRRKPRSEAWALSAQLWRWDRAQHVMKDHWYQVPFRAVLLAASLVLCGCSSINVNTKAYLGSPKYAASDPARVAILAAEPKQATGRLGEIMLSVGGNPPREELEDKLKRAASKLGADAVYVAYDKTHVFPLVYAGWWGGPYGVSEDTLRDIVAVAIKYK
jgi:hypothetical protein